MASYATLADLAIYAVAPTAFQGLSDDVKQAQLDAASTLAEGYLADQYHLPIVAPYPTDLRMNVCQIASFFLITSRGFRPGGADELFRLRYEDAVKWFRDIATGIITPAGIIDSSPDVREGGPTVISGAMGNTIGGIGATPSITIGTKPYPFTGGLPGRRGW